MVLLEGYTVNGACQLRLEDEVGVIAPGMQADLVVLERDLFREPAHRIHTVRVDMTMLAGRISHSRVIRARGRGTLESGNPGDPPSPASSSFHRPVLPSRTGEAGWCGQRRAVVSNEEPGVTATPSTRSGRWADNVRGTAVAEREVRGGVSAPVRAWPRLVRDWAAPSGSTMPSSAIRALGAEHPTLCMLAAAHGRRRREAGQPQGAEDGIGLSR